MTEDGNVEDGRRAEALHRHSIVLVDTCQLFREGLTKILNASRFSVVMASAQIGEALAEVDLDDAAVDMLICSLDPQRGIEAQLAAIHAMRRRDRTTKTVLLMPSCSVEDLVAAVLCGVDGVILKDVSGETLTSVLELIMRGQHVLPLGVASQIFARLQPHAGRDATPTVEAVSIEPASHAPARPAEAAVTVCTSVFGAADAASRRERASLNPTRSLGLSERETQILQCLIEGCANKLIARRLDIAEATVKVHIKGLLRKINVSNRTQAAIWALNQSVSAGQAMRETPPHGLEDSVIPEMVAVFPPVAPGLASHL